MKPADTVVNKTDESVPPNNTNNATEGSGLLQWFREGVAGIISLVILAVAALMLYGAFTYARDTPATADTAILQMRKEAHERQKDIMLYAIALLGTVTGYYLGRAPAELHAQQAQKSANSANQQLNKAQSRLTETASDAAAAFAQADLAKQEKETVQTKLKKAADCLDRADQAISSNLAEPQEKTLGPTINALNAKNLVAIKKDIENTLRDLRGF